MLCLVGIVFSFFIKLVQHFAFAINNISGSALYFSFGAYNQFIHFTHGTRYMAALTVELRAIGELILYKVMVEYLTVIYAFTYLPAPHTLCAYRVGIFKPAYCI